MPRLAPLAAVVAVVVVGAQVRDVAVAEDPDEPAREGGLARSRVAHHTENDGTGHDGREGYRRTGVGRAQSAVALAAGVMYQFVQS